MRSIMSIYIKNLEAAVENGQIKEYRINAKFRSRSSSQADSWHIFAGAA